MPSSYTTPIKEAKASLQEREVHKYYSAWLTAQGTALNVAAGVDSLAQFALQGQGFTPQASRDKALTAFAQLAALRLNVKRAMVSLIDQSNQMILAEGTYGMDSSELWLGATVLSRPTAVCEHSFYNTASSLSQDGHTYSCRGLIVNDCRLDDRFKDRSYVVEEPGVRFYTGVPIVSPNGIMIGAYAVSDDKPRDGLSEDDLRFMQTMSATIMDHFEWARDRVDRFKGERIVRGMASFIEGCSAPDLAPVADERDHATADKSASGEAQPIARPALTSRKSYGASRRSLDQTRPKSRASSRPRGDSISSMYHRAATTMRASALADGAAIFGSSPTSATSSLSLPEGTPTSDSSDAMSRRPSPGSDGAAYDTSDSDTSPSLRPCKVLALALADEKARSDIEQGSALTLATLEKYFSLYPNGKAFSFTDQGSGISSDDESASDREPAVVVRPNNGTDHDEKRSAIRKRKKALRMDHKELLKKIPGAKAVIFLPLYDHAEERLVAGCFLWTSDSGRMMSHDDDLSYLRAFGNSIMSEVTRINTQKNEAAKTTFIASMSHELRSPLHGILGAAEFLRDTAQDSFQSALISSIGVCGKTLLETLNHVLDYSKINRLGQRTMRRNAKMNRQVNLPSDANLESLNMTADVDLAILVEEVVEAVTAGHNFKKLPASAITAVLETSKTGKATDYSSVDALTTGSELAKPTASKESSHVSVLCDIHPRRAWMVRTQPGAIRRIIMNLIGNALKYTPSGFVAVSLRSQENPKSSKIESLIRVVDSGKGMSEDFQRDKLFLPFSQEDSFQPGTGLGLSIVKQIVDSLGGSIEVRSQQDVGTEINVHLNLVPGADSAASAPDDIVAICNRTRGLRMVLDPSPEPDRRPLTHGIVRLEETLRAVCSNWFGLRVCKANAAEGSCADMCLYSEPPGLDELLQQHRSSARRSVNHRPVPIIILCATAEEAIAVSRHQGQGLIDQGGIVEVIPQPCGPRKLGKVLRTCLDRIDERRSSDKGAEATADPSYTSSEGVASYSSYDPIPESEPLPGTSDPQPPRNAPLSKTVNAALSFPSPPPINPETPALLSPRQERPQNSRATSSQNAANDSEAKLHVLLVDDNKINLQLLVMFMKKHKFSYIEAENGQEALDKFQAACLPGPQSDAPGRRFDYILMDISMPILNGMEATKRIREFETENGLPRTTVIALTGLASEQAQREAHAMGIDVFLPKPVKFAKLRQLLDKKE